MLNSKNCKLILFYIVADINECIGVTCENGATCQNNIAGFICDCLNGFAGVFCEGKNCIVYLHYITLNNKIMIRVNACWIYTASSIHYLLWVVWATPIAKGEYWPMVSLQNITFIKTIPCYHFNVLFTYILASRHGIPDITPLSWNMFIICMH